MLSCHIADAEQELCAYALPPMRLANIQLADPADGLVIWHLLESFAESLLTNPVAR